MAKTVVWVNRKSRQSPSKDGIRVYHTSVDCHYVGQRIGKVRPTYASSLPTFRRCINCTALEASQLRQEPITAKNASRSQESITEAANALQAVLFANEQS